MSLVSVFPLFLVFKMQTLKASNCSVCAEPIYHPICIDCLGKSIRRWLNSEALYLLSEFESFHEKVKDNFWKDLEGWEKCVRCDSPSHLVLCMYCYVREVYHHLRQFNQSLADEFTRTFDFDFENTGYHSDFELEEVPTGEVKSTVEPGVCEECENYSEFLRSDEAAMKCRTCEGE